MQIAKLLTVLEDPDLEPHWTTASQDPWLAQVRPGGQLQTSLLS